MLFLLLLSTITWGMGNATEPHWFNGFIEYPEHYRFVEDKSVRFFSNISSGKLLVLDDRLTFYTHSKETDQSQQFDVVFDGMSSLATFKGIDERREVHNFIQESGTESNHSYNGILIQNIYRKIDLELFANEDGLKYNFIVRPGGNIDDISLNYLGSELEKTGDRSLKMESSLARLTDEMPLVYQTIKGRRIERNATLDINNGSVQFNVVEFDKSSTLIIDPNLIFSTFLSSTDNDEVEAMEFSSTQELLVLSNTTALDFPYTVNGGTIGMTSDFVLTKFGKGGRSVIWSTYFQSNDFVAEGMDVEWHVGNTGKIAVTGHGTNASAVSNKQTTFGQSSGTDAFVALFNSNGTFDRWVTLAGTGDDYAQDIAFDENGNLTIVGFTNSDNITEGFPVQTSAHQNSLGGGYDAFLAKISPDLGQLYWATYMGGPKDDAFFALDINKEKCSDEGQLDNPDYGAIYTTGATQTSLFSNFAYNYYLTETSAFPTGQGPAAYSHTSTSSLPIRGLVTINIYSSGGNMMWATDMGADMSNSNNGEAGLSIAVGHLEDDGDKWSKILVGGVTKRDYLPTYPEGIERVNAPNPDFQNGNIGGDDGFIMEFLLDVTRFGTSGNYTYETSSSAIEFWGLYNTFDLPSVYISPCFGGGAVSTNPEDESFPYLNIVTNQKAPYKLVFSSLFGGSGDDCITFVDYDPKGDIVATGVNGSNNWWNLTGSLGGDDAFVMSIGNQNTYSDYLANTPTYTVDLMEQLGGTNDDRGNAVLVENCSGVANGIDRYVGGSTASTDFPTNPAAYLDNFIADQETGFVTRYSDQYSRNSNDGTIYCRSGVGPYYPAPSLVIGNSVTVVDPPGLNFIDYTGYLDPDNAIQLYESNVALVPFGVCQDLTIGRSISANGCQTVIFEKISIFEDQGYVGPTLASSYSQYYSTPIPLFDPTGTCINVSLSYILPQVSGFAQVSAQDIGTILTNGLSEFSVQGAIDYLISQNLDYCSDPTISFEVSYEGPNSCFSQTETIVIDVEEASISYVNPSINSPYFQYDGTMISLFDFQNHDIDVELKYDLDVPYNGYQAIAHSGFYSAPYDALDIDAALNSLPSSCSNTSVSFQLNFDGPLGCLSETETFEVHLKESTVSYAAPTLNASYDKNVDIQLFDFDNMSITTTATFEILDNSSTVLESGTLSNPSAFIDLITYEFNTGDALTAIAAAASSPCAASIDVFKVEVTFESGPLGCISETETIVINNPDATVLNHQFFPETEYYASNTDITLNAIPNDFLVSGSAVYSFDVTNGTTTPTNFPKTGSPNYMSFFDDAALEFNLQDAWDEAKVLSGISCKQNYDFTIKSTVNNTLGCPINLEDDSKIIVPWKEELIGGTLACAYGEQPFDLVKQKTKYGNNGLNTVKRIGSRTKGSPPTTSSIMQTIPASDPIWLTGYDDFLVSDYETFDPAEAVAWEESFNECNCTVSDGYAALEFEIEYTNLEYRSCSYQGIKDEVGLIYDNQQGSATLVSTSPVYLPISNPPWNTYHFCFDSPTALTASGNVSGKTYKWYYENDLAHGPITASSTINIEETDGDKDEVRLYYAIEGQGGCISDDGLPLLIIWEGVGAPLPEISTPNINTSAPYDYFELCDYEVVGASTHSINSLGIQYNPGYYSSGNFVPEPGKWSNASTYVGGTGSQSIQANFKGFYRAKATSSASAYCPDRYSDPIEGRFKTGLSSITTSPASGPNYICRGNTTTLSLSTTGTNYDYFWYSTSLSTNPSWHYGSWHHVHSSPSITVDLPAHYKVVGTYINPSNSSDPLNHCYMESNSVEFRETPELSIEGGVDRKHMTGPSYTFNMDGSLAPNHFDNPAIFSPSQTKWYRNGQFYGNGTVATGSRSILATTPGVYHAESPLNCNTTRVEESNLVWLSSSCTAPPGSISLNGAITPYTINTTQAALIGASTADIYINGIVEIDPGVTLTLHDRVVIATGNSRIVVKKGGTSTNGATLKLTGDTRVLGCNVWDGIYVEGDASSSSRPSIGTPNTTNHGVLEVSSSSGSVEISDAIIAVYSEDGGVVWINDAEFYNNQVDILFDEYSYDHLSSITQSAFLSAASAPSTNDVENHPYFRPTFLPNPGKGNAFFQGVHLYLYKCESINFNNNAFLETDQSMNIFSPTTAIGIKAKETDDVDVLGSGSFNEHLNYGIHLTECDNWTIKDHSFGGSQEMSMSVGAYIKDCNDLEVENCSFTNIKSDGITFLTTLSNHSGCKISRSLFDGCRFGLAVGKNAHPTQTNAKNTDLIDLEIKCNKFINNDIGILGCGNLIDQGSVSTDAGNMFSDPVSPTLSDNVDWDILWYYSTGTSWAQSFTYYYHDNVNCSPSNPSSIDGYEPNTAPTTGSGALSYKKYWVSGTQIGPRDIGSFVTFTDVCNLGAGNTTCSYTGWKKGTTIDEVPQVTEIELFPNPFDHQLKIEMPDDFVGDIHVEDLLGRAVYTGQNKSGKQVLETSSWPCGTYIVTVASKTGFSKAWKLIKP